MVVVVLSIYNFTTKTKWIGSVLDLPLKINMIIINAYNLNEISSKQIVIIIILKPKKRKKKTYRFLSTL